ncbi:MAG: hypothetical protein FD155_1541 [Bacteroidetes bacterium]|nr:MAG: hypothetical protein FD155_1541 [Bacteroidota bacterium]
MRTSSINLTEALKMKTSKLYLFAMLLALSACSTSGVVYDDVYYSRKSDNKTVTPVLATAPQAGTTVSTPSSNSSYEYQTIYKDEQPNQVATEEPEAVYSTTETVVEPDGTSYSTTETYYDSEYAQRLRRFNGETTSSFGYYDGYNTGCYDCSSSSFSFGFGYPFGMNMSFGYNYGWPYYSGYSPYYGWGYDPFYSPWGFGYGWNNPFGYYGSYYDGYYNGFWDGYYYGGGNWDYPGNSRPSTLYGHRGNRGGGTTIPGRTSDRLAGTNEKSTYSSPRGDRSIGTGSTIGTNSSDRVTSTGADRGQTNVSARPDRGTSVTGDRVSRPVSQDRNQRPTTRPSAEQKVNEYRERYQRPSNSTGNTREQRYERPKSYTSPSVRQPKSSNEYVRPQSTTRSTQNETRTTVTPNRQNVRPLSTPQRSNNGQSVSQPARSNSSGNSSTRSVSQPSRSSSSGSSGGSSYSPSRSSSSGSSGGSSTRSSGSSGSSSSGSSRGGSSGGSSSGGRR